MDTNSSRYNRCLKDESILSSSYLPLVPMYMAINTLARKRAVHITSKVGNV